MLIGTRGTPLRFDVPLPAESLERMTYLYRRGGERPLKHIRDGRLTSHLDIRGLHQLTQASADDLHTALDAAQQGDTTAATP